MCVVQEPFLHRDPFATARSHRVEQEEPAAQGREHLPLRRVQASQGKNLRARDS